MISEIGFALSTMSMLLSECIFLMLLPFPSEQDNCALHVSFLHIYLAYLNVQIIFPAPEDINLPHAEKFPCILCRFLGIQRP